MSSYEELVQLPISTWEIVSTKAFFGIGELGLELRQRPRAVGRVRPDDVRLERGEIELEHALVVLLGVRFDFGVGLEQVAVLLDDGHQRAAVGRLQVRSHLLVVREERGRGADFRAHVADRRLARGADRARAGADVFDDRVGAAGHGELAGDPQDDVLGRGPARELAGEVDGDAARVEKLPRQPRHRFDRVRAADADRARAGAARVRGVRVGADDHVGGETRTARCTTWWMMPAPGPQKPAPNFAAADLRKS